MGPRRRRQQARIRSRTRALAGLWPAAVLGLLCLGPMMGAWAFFRPGAQQRQQGWRPTHGRRQQQGLLLISGASGAKGSSVQARAAARGQQRPHGAAGPLRAMEASRSGSEVGAKEKGGPPSAGAAPEACKGRKRVKREQTLPLVEEQPKEDLNVVLTHAVCDFDSLASAVGLAKLWSHQNPGREAVVCMPQGAHPSVEAFLALHSVLFPIRPLATIDPAHVDKLGVVDASTKDRLGAGQALLAQAREVHVFDHHAMKQPDIAATQLNLEDVGSVTTMVVEQLRAHQVEVTDAEATLLAIGIHADTGSMTYDCTTVRDVEALAWVMRRGARQPVIAEFCHQRLTRDQQQFLSESFLGLNTTVHDGVNIGTVVVDCHEYVGGLARVAQHVLELTSCDVLVWGGLYIQGHGKKQTKRLVLIGRARSGISWVDFDEIFKPLGGGGHMKAAAANIKFDPDPERAKGAEQEVMAQVLEKLKQQVSNRGDLKVAGDIMEFPVLTIYRDASMAQVAHLLRKYSLHALPVVSSAEGEQDVVMGVVTDVEVLKAFKAGKMASPVSGWLLKKIGTVTADTNVDEVQRVMAEHDGRDVLVMDRTGTRLVGLISRTDVLQSQNFYSPDSFASKEAFCAKDFAADAAEARGPGAEGAKKGQGPQLEEPCKVCSAHTECAEFKR